MKLSWSCYEKMQCIYEVVMKLSWSCYEKMLVVHSHMNSS